HPITQATAEIIARVVSKWLKASSHLESSKRAQFRERQILSSAGRMIQGAPDLASSEGARFRERRILHRARAHDSGSTGSAIWHAHFVQDCFRREKWCKTAKKVSSPDGVG